MKFAYLTTYDAKDCHNWSGTATHMARAFQRQGVDVHFVGNLGGTSHGLRLAKEFVYSRILGQRYLPERSPLHLKSCARIASRRLLRLDPDIVFSPGSLPVACLDTRVPVVFWTDATFAGMVDYYPTYTGLCRETVRNGNRMEQAALDRCALAVYSSEWAAKTALKRYRVAPEKVRVVPFGANLECSPSTAEVEEALRERPRATCRLLLIGVNETRKGTDIALQVAAELNARGLPAQLTLVGARPAGILPDYVHSTGYIDKGTPRGHAELVRLLARAHFLLGPSRADCTPIAFCEANAFGVPCLARDTGGVGSLIRNGVNGYLFGAAARAAAYADCIESLMRDNGRYRELARSAHECYRSRLNWDTAVCEVLRHIRELPTTRCRQAGCGCELRFG